MLSFFLLGALASRALAAPANTEIKHWVYSSEVTNDTLALLDRPDIVGVQSLYRWKSLEPNKDEYDFSSIKDDLKLVQAKGKQLWVQLQDRTFVNENIPVPEYMHQPIYTNGSVPQCGAPDCDQGFRPEGWITVHWNEHVRERFQALLKAMSSELDGAIYGMNLAETSIDPEENKNNYTCQGYFDGELDNAKYAASVFKKSYVVQYVNFWPCGWGNENNYLSTSFEFYAKNGVGIGGPDLIPYRPGQENNSYPYLTEYSNKVPISVIAVQEPDLEAINPNTSKPFTKQEFTDYAVNVLKSQIIFWAESTPWLQGSPK